jgi:hypothetical protein
MQLLSNSSQVCGVIEIVLATSSVLIESFHVHERRQVYLQTGIK